jgi:hypothetical protein
MIGVVYMAETLNLMQTKGIDLEPLIDSGEIKILGEIQYLLTE